MEINHYVILGLPSGEEGAKLTHAYINKAYRTKDLELHPDKCPDDPNANKRPCTFLRLQTSYEILKDEKKRKDFDDQRHHQSSKHDSRKRKRMDDLDERERASFALARAKSDASSYDKKMKESKEKIISMLNSKAASTFSKFKTPDETHNKSNAQSAINLDYSKTLMVECFVEYSAQRLKELFGEFGPVEDVLIQSEKKDKIWSALVIMASSTDAAEVAAVKGVLGDLSNPLLVLPIQKKDQASVSPYNKISNLVGAGYQDKEDPIIEKMLKKAKESRSG
ncbi:hypothetical protein MKW98_022150 [Papaver atlanticum]|uniref:J domain-containing protein n=1 Tax=Papaver atlanticum TaxID=357466 RepID=A0AAD4XNJ0_9MAGN|nr:hypothetical protein MKW98_022150 [Papaver atlanticum]